ncbi:MAG: cell division protein FtsN [Arenicella sp.]|jgi:cell division protein FtsN
MLVILISGVVLGALLNGARTDDSQFGAGLKALFASTETVTDAEDKAIEALIKNKSTEKEFDFYTVLPDIEQIMPDDLPNATPTKARDDLHYYLQAASFKSHADAEKLRARLALKGFKSITQARSSEAKGTLYRVRLGPYTDKRKAKTAKNKLQKLGVRPFVFTVKKGA